MPIDHSRVPVLEAMQKFRERGDHAYGPPGHRQGKGVDPRVLAVMGEGAFASDILTLNGLDDRRESQGVLTQAQELMADAVHAETCFFSTCGSSLSVKSAMISIAGPGEKLLVSRNAHKSVVSALIISGVQPVWVHPHFDPELHLAHPPETEDFQRALEANPDVKGALLITPTDWGTCADIKGTAEVCHAAGIPLIVDEAWGAHLPFHQGLPTWGMDAGADLVVTSVHKMGAAVEQSSVFHLQGDRIDPAVLKQREDLLGTTSSSSIVYASLDGWRRQMVEHGERLLTEAMARAGRISAGVAALPGLSVMGREVVRPGAAFDLDPLSIVVDVRGLGLSGFEVGDWMRAAYHVDLAGTDSVRVAMKITHGDDDSDEQRVVDAFRRLIEDGGQIERQPRAQLPEPHGLELETAMTPRDAFFARVEQVPAAEAVGRVAAEMVTPYPPGVPVLVPGERITQEALDYLVSGPPAGMLIPDAADSELKTLRVVGQ